MELNVKYGHAYTYIRGNDKYITPNNFGKFLDISP